MGWNNVQQTFAHPLWQGIDDNSRFYFVHSYYVEPADQNQLLANPSTATALQLHCQRTRCLLCNFHPEKASTVVCSC